MSAVDPKRTVTVSQSRSSKIDLSRYDSPYAILSYPHLKDPFININETMDNRLAVPLETLALERVNCLRLLRFQSG